MRYYIITLSKIKLMFTQNRPTMK